MKKFAFTSLLLGAFVSGLASTATAAECYPYQPACCEWSLCDGAIKLGADWLYWKTTADCLPYASSFTTTPSNPGFLAEMRRHLHFQYDNGYRVVLGYELPGNKWELDAIYNYIPSSAHVKLETPDVFHYVSSSISPSHASKLKAKWDNNLSYFDLDLSRTLTCGECFQLRPHIGFRAAWQDYKYRVESLLLTSTEDSENVSYGRESQNFQGYGIEGGLWADWLIGCGLSIVGHVGGSAMYSETHAHRKTYEIDYAANGGSTEHSRNTSRATFRTGTPTFDYFVGLEYADIFCEMEISAHIGWEQHTFFNMTQTAQLNQFNVQTASNMTVQGLTLGLDVVF